MVYRWPAPRYWSLCLLLLPVATLFGNALVCLSVCTDRGLHTATNYFIVSLAIADIMVAILVMPLAVYVEVRHVTYLLCKRVCTLYCVQSAGYVDMVLPLKYSLAFLFIN